MKKIIEFIGILRRSACFHLTLSETICSITLPFDLKKKNNRGFVQILPLVLFAVFTGIMAIITVRVQQANVAEIRSRAATNYYCYNTGDLCSSAGGTSVAKTYCTSCTATCCKITTGPTPTPTPAPYCSYAVQEKCGTCGCTPTTSGGICKACPTSTPTPTPKPPTSTPITVPYCSYNVQEHCGYGCTPTLTGGICKPAPTATPKPPTPTPITVPYCSYNVQEHCACGCTPTTSGGVCKACPTPTPTPTPKPPTPLPTKYCPYGQKTSFSGAVVCNEAPVYTTSTPKPPTLTPTKAAEKQGIAKATPTPTKIPAPTSTSVCLVKIPVLNICLKEQYITGTGLGLGAGPNVVNTSTPTPDQCAGIVNPDVRDACRQGKATPTPTPTSKKQPGDTCSEGFLGLFNTCKDCPYGTVTTSGAKGGKITRCATKPAPAPVVTITPSLTSTPKPTTLTATPSRNLAVNSGCDTDGQCQSGNCEPHFENGVLKSKKCVPKTTSTPTPLSSVIPVKSPTPSPLPASSGTCAGGDTINTCAKADTNSWVRCTKDNTHSGIPYYKADPSCAVYTIALADGSTLTVNLETDTSSNLPTDKVACYNNATQGIGCEGVGSYGSCSSDKAYICDCTKSYRFPTLRETTDAEKKQCGTSTVLFQPPAVEKALAAKQAEEEAKASLCSSGCDVGGKIYQQGSCMKSGSKGKLCECSELTGWKPIFRDIPECDEYVSPDQSVGTTYSKSAGFFCGDDGNVYSNEASPKLETFCRNGGQICSDRDATSIQCTGAASVDQLTKAGLGGSASEYMCSGVSGYRSKTDFSLSSVHNCPAGTACQEANGIVQCAQTQESWEKFIAQYQTTAQEQSLCPSGTCKANACGTRTEGESWVDGGYCNTCSLYNGQGSISKKPLVEQYGGEASRYVTATQCSEHFTAVPNETGEIVINPDKKVSIVVQTTSGERTLSAGQAVCVDGKCVAAVMSGGSTTAVDVAATGTTSAYASSCPSECSVYSGGSGNTRCTQDGTSAETWGSGGKGSTYHLIKTTPCSSGLCSAGACVWGARVIDASTGKVMVCAVGETCTVIDPKTGWNLTQTVQADTSGKTVTYEAVTQWKTSSEQLDYETALFTYAQENLDPKYLAAFDEYKKQHPDATLEEFQKVQDEALERIIPTLQNLGYANDPDYMARIQNGGLVPSELEKTLDDLKKNPLTATVLFINNFSHGATKRGNDLLMSNFENCTGATLFSCKLSESATVGNIISGGVMQGAAPAASVALVAGGIIAAPIIAGVGATAGALTTAGVSLAYLGTAYGAYNAVSTWQQTAEYCNEATVERIGTSMCTKSAIDSAAQMGLLFIGAGAGQAQMASTLATAKSGVALISGAEQAVTATAKTLVNATTIRALNIASGVANTGYFGYKAYDACVNGVPIDEKGTLGKDPVSCGTNIGMAAVSALRLGAALLLPTTGQAALKANTYTDIGDFGVNGTQAVIACSSGDSVSCGNALAGLALSGGGLASGIGHLRTPEGSTITLFEEAEQNLRVLYADPANPQKGQYAVDVTQQQVTAAEQAFRSAIVVRGQEQGLIELALKPLKTPESELTIPQKNLIGAQEKYQALLTQYQKVAELPIAERVKTPEFIEYQKAAQDLLSIRKAVDFENILVTAPKVPTDSEEYKAYTAALSEYEKVASAAAPGDPEYTKALTLLDQTRQKAVEAGYTPRQVELNNALKTKQTEYQQALEKLAAVQDGTTEALALRQQLSGIEQEVKVLTQARDEAGTTFGKIKNALGLGTTAEKALVTSQPEIPKSQTEQDTIRTIQYEATRQEFAENRVRIETDSNGKVALVAESSVSPDVHDMVTSLNRDLRTAETLISQNETRMAQDAENALAAQEGRAAKTVSVDFSIRGAEADAKNQIRIIANALFSSNADVFGKLYESITGSGKSSVIIPMIAELKAKYSGKDVFVILNKQADIDGIFRKFTPEMFRELGADVSQYTHDTDVRQPAFQDSRIILTTKDVIFDSIRTGVDADAIMSKVRGSVLVADEAQLTLRLEVDYNVSNGNQKPIADTNAGKHLIDVFEDVYQKTESFRKQAADNPDLVIRKDGRGIIADPQIQEQVERAMVGDAAPQIEEIARANRLSFEQALDVYLTTDFDSAAAQSKQLAVRERVSALNSITKVLADVPDTNFGINAEGRIVPHDDGVDTGRQFSNPLDALAYEQVGKDKLGRSGDVNLKAVTISDGSVTTNYAEFLKNFSEFYGFSGTPDQLKQQFARIYGVKVDVSTVNQTRFVFGDYDAATHTFSKSSHPIASVRVMSDSVSELTIGPPVKGRVTNVVIENPDISSKDVVAQLRSTNPNVDIASLDPNGKYILNRADGTTEVFLSLEAQDVYLKANYYNASPPREFIRVFEYGTHTGTDTYHTSGDSFIHIMSENTTRTSGLQGIGRDRGTYGGYAEDTTVIVMKKGAAAGSMTHEDLLTMLTANENRAVQQIELDGIKRIVTNKVVEFIHTLEDADPGGAFGLSNKSKYQNMIDTWLARSELDYSVGRGETAGVDVLSDSFKRAQDYIRSLEGEIPAKGPVRNAYNRISGGGVEISSITLADGAGKTQLPAGIKPFNEASSLIELKASVEAVVGKGDIPATIARGVDRADTGYVAARTYAATTVSRADAIESALSAVDRMTNPKQATNTMRQSFHEGLRAADAIIAEQTTLLTNLTDQTAILRATSELAHARDAKARLDSVIATLPPESLPQQVITQVSDWLAGLTQPKPAQQQIPTAPAVVPPVATTEQAIIDNAVAATKILETSGPVPEANLRLPLLTGIVAAEKDPTLVDIETNRRMNTAYETDVAYRLAAALGTDMAAVQAADGGPAAITAIVTREVTSALHPEDLSDPHRELAVQAVAALAPQLDAEKVVDTVSTTLIAAWRSQHRVSPKAAQVSIKGIREYIQTIGANITTWWQVTRTKLAPFVTLTEDEMKAAMQTRRWRTDKGWGIVNATPRDQTRWWLARGLGGLPFGGINPLTVWDIVRVATTRGGWQMYWSKHPAVPAAEEIVPAGFVANPYPGAGNKYIPVAWSTIPPVEEQESAINTQSDADARLEALEQYLRIDPINKGLTEQDIQDKLARAKITYTLGPVEAIFEKPLVEAGKILRNKNIDTVFSEASGKSWPGTNLGFRGTTLTDENKQILLAHSAQELPDYRGSGGTVYMISIDATNKTPDAISQEYVALVNLLKSQTAVPAPALVVTQADVDTAYTKARNAVAADVATYQLGYVSDRITPIASLALKIQANLDAVLSAFDGKTGFTRPDTKAGALEIATQIHNQLASARTEIQKITVDRLTDATQISVITATLTNLVPNTPARQVLNGVIADKAKELYAEAQKQAQEAIAAKKAADEEAARLAAAQQATAQQAAPVTSGIFTSEQQTIIQANLVKFTSREFSDVLITESWGGNAGANHAAVNAAVDASGRIIAFGNFQDLPADIRSKLNSGEYLRPAFVYGEGVGIDQIAGLSDFTPTVQALIQESVRQYNVNKGFITKQSAPGAPAAAQQVAQVKAAQLRAGLQAQATKTAVESKATYVSSLQKATAILQRGSGIVQLPTDIPTIVVSDLHARRDFLMEALGSPVTKNGPTVLELLVQRKINVVVNGDGMHSEVKRVWPAIGDKNYDQKMYAEMVRSLNLMKMIMDLKAAFPDNFHYIRGNHDDINGEYTKYVSESYQVRQWMETTYGGDFIRQWSSFENALPILAIGKTQYQSFVISHTAPTEAYTLNQINTRDPSITTGQAGYSGLLWTDNTNMSDQRLMQPVKGTLRNLGLPDTAQWIIGHRSVEPGTKYRSQLGGQLVQINDANNHLVAFIPADKVFDPAVNIKSLNGFQTPVVKKSTGCSDCNVVIRTVMSLVTTAQDQIADNSAGALDTIARAKQYLDHYFADTSVFDGLTANVEVVEARSKPTQAEKDDALRAVEKAIRSVEETSADYALYLEGMKSLQQSLELLEVTPSPWTEYATVWLTNAWQTVRRTVNTGITTVGDQFNIVRNRVMGLFGRKQTTLPPAPTRTEDGTWEYSDKQLKILQSPIKDWLTEHSSLVDSMVSGKRSTSFIKDYQNQTARAVAIVNAHQPSKTPLTIASPIQTIAGAAAKLTEEEFIKGIRLSGDRPFEQIRTVHPQEILDELFSADALLFDSSGSRVSLEAYLRNRYQELISRGMTISLERLSRQAVLERLLSNLDWTEERRRQDPSGYQLTLGRMKLKLNLTDDIVPSFIPTITLRTPDGRSYTIPLVNNPLGAPGAYGQFTYYTTEDNLVRAGWVNYKATSFLNVDTGETDILAALFTTVHELDHAIYHSISASHSIALRAEKNDTEKKVFDRESEARQIMEARGDTGFSSQLADYDKQLSTIHRNLSDRQDLLLGYEYDRIADERKRVLTEMVMAAFGPTSAQYTSYIELQTHYEDIKAQIVQIQVYIDKFGTIVSEGLARNAQEAMYKAQGQFLRSDRLTEYERADLMTYLNTHTSTMRDAIPDLAHYGIGASLITMPSDNPFRASAAIYVDNVIPKYFLAHPEALFAAAQSYAGRVIDVDTLLHPGLPDTERTQKNNNLVKQVLQNQYVFGSMLLPALNQMDATYAEYARATEEEKKRILAGLEDDIRKEYGQSQLDAIRTASATDADYFPNILSYRFTVMEVTNIADNILHLSYDFAAAYGGLSDFVRSGGIEQKQSVEPQAAPAAPGNNQSLYAFNQSFVRFMEATEAIGNWFKTQFNTVRNRLSGVTQPAGQDTLRILLEQGTPLTQGQVVERNGVYYRVKKDATTTTLISVIPFVEQVYVAKEASEYPRYIGHNNLLILFDGTSYYFQDGITKQEITNDGISFDNGVVLRRDKATGGVVAVWYTDTLYDWAGRFTIRYTNGKLQGENAITKDEDSVLWMKNGEVETAGAVDIAEGDIITLPAGNMVVVRKTDNGYVFDDYFAQYAMTDADRKTFVERFDANNTPEMVAYVRAAAEKMNVTLHDYWTINPTTGLLTEDYGDLSMFHYDEDYTKLLSTNSERNSTYREQLVVRRAVIEYLLDRDPVAAAVYKKYLDSLEIFQDASPKTAVDRYDFEIKKLEARVTQRKLTPSEEQYLSVAKKLKHMWELISGFSPDAIPYMQSILDELDPSIKSQFQGVFDQMRTVQVQDTPLFRSYVERKTPGDTSSEILPGFLPLAEPFTWGHYMELAYGRLIAPENSISTHQQQVSTFWNSYFASRGIQPPAWFSVYTYSGDEMTFMTRAHTAENNIANVGGNYFLRGDLSSEEFVHIMNHEATHKIISQEKGPRINPTSTVRPVKSAQAHNEIVVEFLAQMESTGKLNEYPPKDRTRFDTAYQEGVRELIAIFQEIDQKAGAPMYSLDLLVRGVVDYNAGNIAFPLSYVVDAYIRFLNKTDFFTRLENYTDTTFKSTTSGKQEPDPQIINQKPVTKPIPWSSFISAQADAVGVTDPTQVAQIQTLVNAIVPEVTNGKLTYDDVVAYLDGINPADVQKTALLQKLFETGPPSLRSFGEVNPPNEPQQTLLRHALQYLQSQIAQQVAVTQQSKSVLEKLQALLHEVNNKDCLAYNPIMSRVYAAPSAGSGQAEKKDESDNGNSCAWYLRAPWKVMRNVVLVGGLSTLLSDSTGRILAVLQQYLAFLNILKPPPLPSYKQLPSVPVTDRYCPNGACSAGCGDNMECGDDGYDSQCCIYKKGGMTACSTRGFIYLKGDDRVFSSERLEGSNPVEKITTMADTINSPVYGVPAVFTNIGMSPDFYTCVGGCNSQSGCDQLADRCPIPGMIDTVGAKGFECREDGKWMPLSLDETLVKTQSLFQCASDGRSIIDMQTDSVLKTCDPNDTCMKSTPTVCKPTGSVYACSVNQQYVNGYGGLRCTATGPRCTPNQNLTLIQPNFNWYPYYVPCQMRCNALGNDAIYTEPLTCVPSPNAYVDRTCINSNVYQIRNDRGTNSNGSQEPQLVEQCNNGCTNGFCKAMPLAGCPDGQIAAGWSNDCPLVCNNGHFVLAPWCGKVDVLAYNNQIRYTAYSALSLLPSHLFDKSGRFPIVMSWQENVVRPFVVGKAYGPGESGLPFAYTLNTTKDLGYEDMDTIIHEFLHIWADAQGRKEITSEQYNQLYSQFVAWSQWENLPDVLKAAPYALAPSSYMKLTGCTLAKETWTFQYKPEYNPCEKGSNEPCTQPCWEDWAYSGDQYVMNACELKKLSPDRYEYFRDTIFQGKEYIPAAGCGGN